MSDLAASLLGFGVIALVVARLFKPRPRKVIMCLCGSDEHPFSLDYDVVREADELLAAADPVEAVAGALALRNHEIARLRQELIRG